MPAEVAVGSIAAVCHKAGIANVEIKPEQIGTVLYFASLPDDQVDKRMGFVKKLLIGVMAVVVVNCVVALTDLDISTGLAISGIVCVLGIFWAAYEPSPKQERATNEPEPKAAGAEAAGAAPSIAPIQHQPWHFSVSKVCGGIAIALFVAMVIIASTVARDSPHHERASVVAGFLLFAFILDLVVWPIAALVSWRLRKRAGVRPLTSPVFEAPIPEPTVAQEPEPKAAPAPSAATSAAPLISPPPHRTRRFLVSKVCGGIAIALFVAILIVAVAVDRDSRYYGGASVVGGLLVLAFIADLVVWPIAALVSWHLRKRADVRPLTPPILEAPIPEPTIAQESEPNAAPAEAVAARHHDQKLEQRERAEVVEGDRDRMPVGDGKGHEDNAQQKHDQPGQEFSHNGRPPAVPPTSSPTHRPRRFLVNEVCGGIAVGLFVARVIIAPIFPDDSSFKSFLVWALIADIVVWRFLILAKRRWKRGR